MDQEDRTRMEQPGDGKAESPAMSTADAAGEPGPETSSKLTVRNAAPQIIEALLFASDAPVSASRLAGTLGKSFDGRAVRRIIADLNAFYAEHNRAFEILEIAGGFQVLTRPEYRRWVAELHRHRRQDKLSQPAIETLAIIAYRQPVLRATIDDIRGIQSGPLLRALLERGLIKIVGHQNVPGHPRLYGTSRLFLEQFGLKSLKDLPKVAELTPP